jgi:hypothetical protein
MPLCSMIFIASKFAMDPSTIEQIPSFHIVPARIKLPLQSRTHHPILVLFIALWKPASTLHCCIVIPYNLTRVNTNVRWIYGGYSDVWSYVWK